MKCAVNRLLVEGKFDRIHLDRSARPPRSDRDRRTTTRTCSWAPAGRTSSTALTSWALSGEWSASWAVRRRPCAPCSTTCRANSARACRSRTCSRSGRVTPRARSSTRGLYAGDDEACFHAGVPLVQRVNLELLSAPRRKVVVYLDPAEFKSTWLGNKAIYRTRMAIADEGELVVLAPGGEDLRGRSRDRPPDPPPRLPRNSAHAWREVESDPELAASLSAAAHLIHGSSEGRFRITYAPGGLDRAEVEGVGFEYADPGSRCPSLRPDAPLARREPPRRRRRDLLHLEPCARLVGDSARASRRHRRRSSARVSESLGRAGTDSRERTSTDTGRFRHGTAPVNSYALLRDAIGTVDSRLSIFGPRLRRRQLLDAGSPGGARRVR